MSESVSSDAAPSPERPSADRLDSWKEIAAYLKRDVTTVQRWEKREGMPVHRHVHDKIGSVYAWRSELDAWTRSRHVDALAARTRDGGAISDEDAGSIAAAAEPRIPSRRWMVAALAA